MITSGGDNTAPSAANDDRFVAKGRIVSFFDGAVKRITVYMGDGQGCNFGVGNQTSRTTSPAHLRRKAISAAISTILGDVCRVGSHEFILCFT
jgi:hypothetical protein